MGTLRPQTHRQIQQPRLRSPPYPPGNCLPTLSTPARRHHRRRGSIRLRRRPHILIYPIRCRTHLTNQSLNAHICRGLPPTSPVWFPPLLLRGRIKEGVDIPPNKKTGRSLIRLSLISSLACGGGLRRGFVFLRVLAVNFFSLSSSGSGLLSHRSLESSVLFRLIVEACHRQALFGFLPCYYGGGLRRGWIFPPNKKAGRSLIRLSLISSLACGGGLRRGFVFLRVLAVNFFSLSSSGLRTSLPPISRIQRIPSYCRGLPPTSPVWFPPLLLRGRIKEGVRISPRLCGLNFLFVFPQYSVLRTQHFSFPNSATRADHPRADHPAAHRPRDGSTDAHRFHQRPMPAWPSAHRSHA